MQDWILKSEKNPEKDSRFFTNLRSLGKWRVKGTEESTFRVDSLVALTHHDPRDLGLDLGSWIETRNLFLDSFGFKNPNLYFLKETHPVKKAI